MEYQIAYYSEAVQDEILALPDTLAARYIVLTRRMAALGGHLVNHIPKLWGTVCLSCASKGLKA